MTQSHRKQQNGKSDSAKVRERAIRLVIEQRDSNSSQCEAIKAIAPTISGTAETLCGWIRQNARNTGQRPGQSSAERLRRKALQRQVRELRQANEIRRKASAFFA